MKKVICLIVLLSAFCLSCPAWHSFAVGQEFENGPGFDSASDFKSPYTYVSESGAQALTPPDPLKTPDGIEHTAKWGRNKGLSWQYARLKFPLKKVFGDPEPARSKERCMVCHKGIEAISENHRFECVRCHQGNPWTVKKTDAHFGMISNPSDLSVADKFCGSAECHGEKIETVKGSLMSTAAGEINITRYFWGSQSDPEPHYGTLSVSGLTQLPEPSDEHPVDDLLRKKCVRCHINSPPPNRKGDYRATGCAACHMVYSNNGRYQGSDIAVLSVQSKDKPQGGESDRSGLYSSRGYPILHRFTNAIPSVQCVHCHNGNRVGNEYMGYLEQGSAPGEAGVDLDGPLLHGSHPLFIVEDIHKEKGMHCIDCHTITEIEGASAIRGSMKHALEVRCSDCHGGLNTRPQVAVLSEDDPEMKVINANPNLKGKIRPGDEILVTRSGVKLVNVKLTGSGPVLISKVTGKSHKVPLPSEMTGTPSGHRVAGHARRVECHACHGKWSASNWGMRLTRENFVSLKGRDRLDSSDPSLAALFDGKNKGAAMIDWLTARPGPGGKGLIGSMLPGVWWDAFDLRDWSALVLGVNSRNKVSLLKPLFQFFYTSRVKPGHATEGTARDKVVLLVDDEAPVSLDQKRGFALSPYAPHTIRKEARSCGECHGNRVAAGLGERDGIKEDKHSDLFRVVTGKGEQIQTLIPLGSARPLNKGEVARLLSVSTSEYKFFLYTALEEQGRKRLLKREVPTRSRPFIPGVSLGDVRETGSTFDSFRAGFFQTDPLQFSSAYSKISRKERRSSRMKHDKDPAIAEEKKHIWDISRTNIDAALELKNTKSFAFISSLGHF